MKFDDLLEEVAALLQRERRVSYRRLKRRYELTDEDIEDLKAELIEARHLATDEDGQVLVFRESGSIQEQPSAIGETDSNTAAIVSADARSTADEAQRRQITVMFCDLVGSTALSERLDPEELREVIRTYHAASAGVIRRFDGHIAQYLGDGLLVYFGYPQAHEDDAQRAVRAGLGIVAVLSALRDPGGPLSVRIGIHTGLVVVGDVGSGTTHERLALGDTPNVAARLQGLAPPSAVLISERTRQLIGATFELEDLGPQHLKGIVTPVHAWCAVAQSAAESRFEATHRGPLAAIVGRESELAALFRAWESAISGAGRAVVLSGEAGIGKSRVLHALRERVAGQGIAPWQLQCSPYFINTALYPVVASLEHRLSADRNDSAEQRLDRLEGILSKYGLPPRTTNLIACLLGLPAEPRYGSLGLSPQKQKEETLLALVDLIEVAAASGPLLILFEDLHWSDPTTLEFTGLLLARLHRLRVLLVVTHRPEFQPDWIGLSHVLTLVLTRLDASQTEAVAVRVAGGKRLPREIVRQIVAKTDGVPLFVEELTKVVLESGVMTDLGEGYELAVPLPALAIPSTLRDSLMARLDRLGTIREVAQIGACIGREFSRDLLALVSPVKGYELDRALTQLVDSELVFRRKSTGEERFAFKHALVQDAAYDSLLKTRRAQVHAQVAQALESNFPETATLEPEVLARHYTAAHLPRQAVPYWLKAGRAATARSANREAIGHLSRGAELVLTQPASPERDRLELDLRVSLTTPIIATHGWGAPEFADAYRQAVDLCDRVDDSDLVTRALYMQWGYGTWTARHRIAEQAAARLLAMADTQEERVARLMGHGLLGRVQCYMGKLREARLNIEQSLALADVEQDRDLAMKYGQDPIMAGLAGLSWYLWLQGLTGQARHARDRAIERAEFVKHPQTLSYALAVSAGIFGMLELDAADVEPRLSRLERLIDEQAFKHWRGLALTARAFVLCVRGERQVARAVASEGRAALDAAGCMIVAPLFAAIRARILLRDGARAEAWREVEEGLATASRTEETFAMADLQRVRGEILLSEGEEKGAAESFEAALVIARAQGSRVLELRAATSLARLWRSQGKRADARELLGPIYGWFTEGFDTPDLQMAQALLTELG